jgi:Probable sensor domain DACNV
MMNPQEIVKVFLEEIKILPERVTFNPPPEARTLQELLTDHPLPDNQSISFVIEEVFWASLLTEENRPCRPHLISLTSDKRRARPHMARG